MEQQTLALDVGKLAERIMLLSRGSVEKTWVCIAGPPGSGKTTLCDKLAEVLNSQGVSSAVLPMDGFHYYRKELDAMPNSQEAHAKRGSHWTFNSQRLLEVIRTIKRVGHGRAPSFDHAHGDPVEDDIIIETSHKVVLVEGNYLLLPETPWNELRDLFDSRWLLLCDESVLRERVIVRNSAAWGWTRERTAERVDSNDMPNARLVINASPRFADFIIESG